MKKLIMFLMVMAIASPSLAVLEDVPPQIDTSMGVTTAVWDFATEPPYIGDPWDENNLPQCIEPDDAYTFMHPIFEGDPAWENGELNSCIWYSVEVPEGGAYVTLYIQVHMGEDSDPPAWVEVQGQDCFPAEVDQCNEYFADDPDPEIVGNVAIYQVTMARDAGMVGLGGFIQGDEFDEAGDRRYTGLIVDVIVHDTPTPPAGGPRISACFEPPVFIIDPNVMTVYETGETEGDFVVSMYNPIPAGETVTVTVDPNSGNGGWGEGSDSDKDIQLIGGQGADNQITLTFDQNNWDVPQTIRFKAIDDEDPEPPDLLEAKRISI
ncbi:MAG TPA: hypothetical protein HPP87_09260, partial [Planctomycetes bacterium]|nr:hypothetical protein [Planctomycetota bacterium]